MLLRLKALIQAHWRGELSPAISLLLVLLGVGYLYNAAASSALSIGFLRDRYLLQLVLFTTVMIFAIPLSLWQFTGTWRAFHKLFVVERPWKRLVGVGGFAFLVFLAAWSVLQIGPRFAALFTAIAEVVDAPSRYSISVGTKGEKGAVFSGDIVWGSASALGEYLAMRPQIVSLEIDSRGGSFQEAAKIAEMIRNRRLATFVRGECMSACTLVFAAGHPRFALTSAKFGFHRVTASLLASKYELEKSNDEYAAVLRSSGIDDPFVDQALKVVPPQIWIPSNNDLKVSKFVEHFVE